MTRSPHRHRLDSHLARFALYCVLALYIVAMVWGASRLDLTATEGPVAAPTMEPVAVRIHVPMATPRECSPGNPRILEGPYGGGNGRRWLVDVMRRGDEMTLLCPKYLSWLPR